MLSVHEMAQVLRKKDGKGKTAPADTSKQPPAEESKKPERDKSQDKCYSCGELGHHKAECTKKTPAFIGIPICTPSLHSNALAASLRKDQIGIDTLGGDHCFGNADILCNIESCDGIILDGVGGGLNMNQMGTFSLVNLDVYYDHKMPVNMLSWGNFLRSMISPGNKRSKP